jgi:hypothetical protein
LVSLLLILLVESSYKRVPKRVLIKAITKKEGIQEIRKDFVTKEEQNLF